MTLVPSITINPQPTRVGIANVVIIIGNPQG
jgi:hypothetical protein